MCHVVNLVVQAILAALGEADDPDNVDYYTLNKEQPLHLDINADPDQVELDKKVFQDDEENNLDDVAENITLEDEERKTEGDSESASKGMCLLLGSQPQRDAKSRSRHTRNATRVPGVLAH
jgi:hypothetical protein